MPDRIMTPKRSAYLVLFMALVMLGLCIWVVTLNSRLGAQESIRRAEERGKTARQAQSCRLLRVFQDVSIDIPLQNYNDLIEGETLTAAERAQKLIARRRYMDAQQFMAGLLRECPK